MMHTQDTVKKVQSHKASCITVSKPLNHLQLRLCFFKFCLNTVRSHFISDLISGLQVFKHMKVFTDLCCCLDPPNAQSVLQLIVSTSCFLKTTWTALRTKVRRLQMRSPWRGLARPSQLSIQKAEETWDLPVCCRWHK